MIIIRAEKPNDYHKVEEITRQAFWNLYCPAATEHYIVHKIRQHNDYIPELSFVIEKDNEVVGSIFYTHSKVVSHGGDVIKTITFGPVSIKPELHRQGLGRKLITHSINEAKRLGYRAIIIGGFTYHYYPYGFVGAKKYGISMPDGKFYTGIMALPLYNGALDNSDGVHYYSEVMDEGENMPQEYDDRFPYLEKLILPQQEKFRKAAAEIDIS